MRFVEENGISQDYKINRDGPTLLLVADMGATRVWALSPRNLIALYLSFWDVSLDNL